MLLQTAVPRSLSAVIVIAGAPATGRTGPAPAPGSHSTDSVNRRAQGGESGEAVTLPPSTVQVRWSPRRRFKNVLHDASGAA